jgi:hypothetical protein
MVAFSGFYESHEPPPSGDAHGIVPPHRDGHQNGQQSGYMLHYCCVDLRPCGALVMLALYCIDALPWPLKLPATEGHSFTAAAYFDCCNRS